ncbi:unnamed protein product [Prorocentrum cordatum]|uniref:Uncharacterized protein n=1 Tax=Prorocentrum cordatum TaxID=2364126 RepID=A0ABN9WPD3_9DINO|nr:unnamed protein product [Polarella glacialis]
MMAVAAKVSATAASLWKKPPAEEQGSWRRQAERRARLSPDASLVAMATSESPRDSNSVYSSEPGESVHSEDLEEYDDDYEGATERVKELLGSFHTAERLALVHELNTAYEERLDMAEEESASLAKYEDEFQARENEIRDDLDRITDSIERKYTREVKVLARCNQSLAAGPKQAKLRGTALRKRWRFSSNVAHRRSNVRMDDADEFLAEDGRSPEEQERARAILGPGSAGVGGVQEGGED